ncbi:hypothetical protein, partial [Sodaliphilus sp.]|uniref:hypothetical protein n=1 Tax=Sodaliphilus sp. TaxID=2815818 RepID=UPI0038907534
LGELGELGEIFFSLGELGELGEIFFSLGELGENFFTSRGTRGTRGDFFLSGRIFLPRGVFLL